MRIEYSAKLFQTEVDCYRTKNRNSANWSLRTVLRTGAVDWTMGTILAGNSADPADCWIGQNRVDWSFVRNQVDWTFGRNPADWRFDRIQVEDCAIRRES